MICHQKSTFSAEFVSACVASSARFGKTRVPPCAGVNFADLTKAINDPQSTLILFDPCADVSVDALLTMPRKMISSCAADAADRGAVEITTGSDSMPPVGLPGDTS